MSRAADEDAGVAGGAQTVGLVSAICCISIVGLVTSFTFQLVSMLLEGRGVSSAMIGVNNSMLALGGILSAPFLPRLVARIGLASCLALGILATVALLLSLKLNESFWWWTSARLLLGVAGAALFMGSEYWIVATAHPRLRGRIVAFYAMALSAGYAAGPALLREVGLDGWTPFLVAAGAATFAAAPLLLAWRSAPKISPRHRGTTLKFVWTDPSVIFAVLLFGVAEFGAMALAPVWGLKIGLVETVALGLGMWLGIGGLALQWPMGWAADRFPARPLLLLAALACLATAAALPLMRDLRDLRDGLAIFEGVRLSHQTLLYAVMFLWGGIAAGLYTIALTAAGKRYEGDDLADASASIVGFYNLGAFFGPMLVGAAMDSFGPDGLPLALGVAATLYCGLVLARLRAA